MDRFNELLNEMIGGGAKKPEAETLEARLKRAREAEARAKAEASELERKLKEEKEKQKQKQEQEIIIRYIPGAAGKVKIIKGGEYAADDKPENVMALAEAIGMILYKHDGVNPNLMTAALLSTIANTLVILAGGAFE